MKALSGVKVLDLTRALAGPYCTLMLGDYGADVIKIEIPGRGDDTRQWGPPFVNGESAYFLSINRNKRSLTLNLKDPAGRGIFMKLAKDADVVVENFTPGVVQRLGIDYESVKGVNPNIVYASISGFGQTGPYRRKPAYDQMMQGLGGIMSLTGEPEGEPQKMGIALTDIGAGMLAAYAITVALFHRERTGEGPVHRCFDAGPAGVLAHLPGGDVFCDGRAAGPRGRRPSEPGAVPGLHVCRR